MGRIYNMFREWGGRGFGFGVEEREGCFLATFWFFVWGFVGGVSRRVLERGSGRVVGRVVSFGRVYSLGG